MVGGGTGYAPLRAMLRQLLASGDRRPLELYRGARSSRDLYEHHWLSSVAAVRPRFKYEPILSEPEADADPWTGRTGLVHEAVLQDHAVDLARYDVYASGPPAMVEAIRHDFAGHGLPREQLFFDSFDYAPDTLAAMRRHEAG
jgi:CDP-4-dehydro-6-deoxyglucose reductase